MSVWYEAEQSGLPQFREYDYLAERSWQHATVVGAIAAIPDTKCVCAKTT